MSPSSRSWGLDVTAVDAEDSCGVQAEPPSFRDLLDEVGDEALRAVMAPWAQTEELRRWMDDRSTEEHLRFAVVCEVWRTRRA